MRTLRSFGIAAVSAAALLTLVAVETAAAVASGNNSTAATTATTAATAASSATTAPSTVIVGNATSLRFVCDDVKRCAQEGRSERILDVAQLSSINATYERRVHIEVEGSCEGLSAKWWRNWHFQDHNPRMSIAVDWPIVLHNINYLDALPPFLCAIHVPVRSANNSTSLHTDWHAFTATLEIGAVHITVPLAAGSSSMQTTAAPIAAGVLATGLPDARSIPYWHAEAPLRKKVCRQSAARPART
jgi:hypothetical protein